MKKEKIEFMIVSEKIAEMFERKIFQPMKIKELLQFIYDRGYNKGLEKGFRDRKSLKKKKKKK